MQRRLLVVLLLVGILGSTLPNAVAQSEETNLALNKPCWMSSYHEVYNNPRRANDGIRSTEITFCVSSLYPIQDQNRSQWWRVDLEKEYIVTAVNLTNRGDCCGELLRDLEIRVARHVSARLAPRQAVTDEETICATRSSPVPQGTTIQIPCDTSVVGRYVTLLKTSTVDVLHFCEMAVFGLDIRVLLAGQRCDHPHYAGEDIICERGSFCPSTHNQYPKCSIPLSGSCNTVAKRTACVNETVCDLGVCLLDTNANCANRERKCNSNTECYQNKCLFKFEADCRTDPKACTYSLVCDVTEKCRRFSNCDTTRDCQAGAVCTDGICDCQNAKIGELCIPRPGFVLMQCSSSRPCITPDSSCQYIEALDTHQCVCVAPTQIVERNFTCAVPPACFNDHGCRIGWVCDHPGSSEAACKVNLARPCVHAFETCKSGTVCDNFVCKLAPGANCTKYKTHCQIGAVCKNGQCRKQLGESCNQREDCVMGAICEGGRSAQKACRLNVGESCAGEDNDKCASIAVCDVGSICKIKPGQRCEGPFQKHCMVGASCQFNVCKLAMGVSCAEAPDQCAIGTCDSLFVCRQATNRPCLTDGDCVAGAYCIFDAARVSFKHCRCNDTISRMVEGSKCGVGIGYSCEREGAKQCTESAVCDMGSICQLDAGYWCTGLHTGSCRLTSICENGQCKLNINERCSGGNLSLCRDNTVCDSLNVCKKSAGAHCLRDDVCLAGATCVNQQCTCNPDISFTTSDRYCSPKTGQAGGACDKESETECHDNSSFCSKSTNKCECRADFAISNDLTCKLTQGKNCSEEEDKCISGTVCDAGICRSTFGYACTDNSSCVTGAVCDVDEKCKSDLNGDCSGEKGVYCKVGTVCDNLKKCRLPVDSPCTHTEDCVAGAVCNDEEASNPTCSCYYTAKVSGLICLPSAGQVGSECVGTKSCSDSLATCDAENGVCQCVDSARLNEHIYKCESTSSASSPIKVAIGILFSIILIGLLVGGVIIYNRRKLQNKKSNAAIAEEQLQVKLDALKGQVEQVVGQSTLDESTLSSATEESDITDLMSSESRTSGATESDMDLSTLEQAESDVNQPQELGQTESDVNQPQELGQTKSDVNQPQELQ